MKKITQIFSLLIKLALYCFAQLIPKNNKTWVFGSWFGLKYNDNPKALYEYIEHNEPSVTPVWISKDKILIKTLNDENHLAFYYLSLKGIYYQLRASKSFVSTSVHDDLFAPCIGKKTQKVQLWHGIPLKKIMFDAFSEKKENQNVFGKLNDLLTPYNKHRNDYLTATSPLTQKIMAGAFRLPLEKTIITGFPRNDVLLAIESKAKHSLYQCIYMPTHRGGMGGDFNLFEKYGFNIEMLDEILYKNSIELTLRLHAFNSPSVQLMEDISKSKMIHIDNTPDIYETINRYDCLITDYSSIYFDFLLTNKPIVFSAFDLEVYKKNERQLYFDFDEVTLNPNCLNWTEVIERVIDLKENDMTDEYKQAYFLLKEKFHGKECDLSESFSKKLFNKLTLIG